ncbi:E3 ubiquitin-protein ligase XBAT33-like isoform X1 [Zingiber officinale]|uniref:E3 ubiquitin-protein ligase XBAT33-like isoform X1 n=2 Tax=Zingiber officinale TaxID=94328 RepID=UPI001C4B724F|nr:E3 ubiquitin-protein ligase XBAT33-like isoform X1 [Zingiber officinale]
MGNLLLGCSAAGERLVTAARDGDVIEAQKLVEMNPGLARYATFAGISSPLHAAAARGHAEIVMMLLEKGANLNSKNIWCHTPLMEACCSGRWEVVQILLLFRCNVSKVELLSGRTALHFASAGGHARCIRLLAADFCPGFSLSTETDSFALTRFINKAANGGITALHLAALNGHSDCVHLLLDVHANISAATLSYASSAMAIGAGSTPLHYAACGGNLKCCQVLLARGARRTAVNCNGWLPVDVARICGSHWLIPLLTPHSSQLVPAFPPSNYLPLPLMSILQIARINGLHSSTSSCAESDLCAVCLERTCTVAAEGCGHELCTRCALCLCSTSSIDSEMSTPPSSVPCPLCRKGIVSFVSLPTTEMEAGQGISLCSKCSGQCQNPFATACGSELCRNPFEIVPPALCGGVSSRTYRNE